MFGAPLFFMLLRDDMLVRKNIEVTCSVTDAKHVDTAIAFNKLALKRVETRIGQQELRRHLNSLIRQWKLPSGKGDIGAATCLDCEKGLPYCRCHGLRTSLNATPNGSEPK